MRWETKRNFLVGGAFFALMVGLVVYQALRTENCDDSRHTVLVLVDYTDPVGQDAIAAVKDRVWTIIEGAPNFSTVVLRPILGKDVSGAMLDKETVELCRPERPDLTSPWKGAVKIRETWRAFKAQVCGKPAASAATDDLHCGDESRKDSFFDKQRPESLSSPILEQVVDNSRRFLTVPNVPKSWDLVVVTDWREYTPQLDLHTRACAGVGRSMLERIPTFIGPDSEDRPFQALAATDAPTGRASSITSLFVLREGMSDAEADCLEREFAQQFIATNAVNIPPSNIAFERLPRTVAGQ